MEWCRMFRLRTVLCVVVLLCVTGVVPDSRQDSLRILSERDKKLQELLKSLESFSVKTRRKMPQERNLTTPQYSATFPPFLMPEEVNLRGKSITKKSEDMFESELGSVSNHQDFYRKFYGTQEGVSFLRKKYGPNGLKAARAKFPSVNKGIEDVKKANDHFLRMRNRARCRTPVPQVFKVKEYYPDPSKDYFPRCALLHRCGDETGCCDSDAFHCVPKTIQEVTLHFYTISIGRKGGDSKVEKLLFQNHTSCHCQPINDLPRIMTLEENDPLDGENDSPNKKCRDCPIPFTTRIYKDGRCGCDCFDKQKPCLRIKRGRDALSKIERRCIEANHCNIPDCEYGEFDTASGYCPKRHDEVPRNQHHRPHPSSPNHRWTFLERD